MPLYDHFRPPFSTRRTWEEFHGMWPAEIVRRLRHLLPPGFIAGPKVHLGPFIEIDIAAYEEDDAPAAGPSGGDGAVATAVRAPARLTLSVETDLPDTDEYEVRIYDATHERTLVAAIELVSPGNKDRGSKRNAFVSKCAALLRQGVAVSIVDLITVRPSNLYAELLAFVGHPDTDPTVGDSPIYAASCRWRPLGKRAVLEGLSHRLVVGEPLPTLPLWLAPDLSVSLDLEAGYRQVCDDLAIG